MNREAQDRLAEACEDLGNDTVRLDPALLLGLIETSEGIATGTPKSGLPVLADDADERLAEAAVDEPAADEPVEAAPVEAAPIEAIEAREPSMPVARPSRLRDVTVGGVLALLVLAAWYCATQL